MDKKLFIRVAPVGDHFEITQYVRRDGTVIKEVAVANEMPRQLPDFNREGRKAFLKERRRKRLDRVEARLAARMASVSERKHFSPGDDLG